MNTDSTDDDSLSIAQSQLIFFKSFFEAYFAMFKFQALRIQETPKEPFITLD